MENGTSENGVCSSESINGAQDVWSCNQSLASSADHLVVMVHGILGSATDWKFAAEQFVRTLPDKVFVHCSERNMAMLTLDGVDVMGERLAGEVLQAIKQKPSLRKISFVAHSVGGVVARYAIGKLFRLPRSEKGEELSSKSCEVESKGTIGGLEPMNFITVATPHLGSRGNNQTNYVLSYKFKDQRTRILKLEVVPFLISSVFPEKDLGKFDGSGRGSCATHFSFPLQSYLFQNSASKAPPLQHGSGTTLRKFDQKGWLKMNG
ncbi:hypothetical protein TEA_009847 [Camellia sinensis var. sinensis]|uniref:DUF676 domain-containing protein n=1 Tax=Camellia sinensis var. sinensis TaxID=542762 RepID=A0A4S4D8U5_CAMSN|nr:hypothetical protein TEA_009847 [Camellia sinensis var. sinensis]